MNFSIIQAKPIADYLSFDPPPPLEVSSGMTAPRGDLTLAGSQIAPLRAKAERLLRLPRSRVDLNSIITLQGEAEAIDSAFEVWIDSLPSWVPKTLFHLDMPILADISQMTAWPGPIDAYPSVLTCGILIKYYAARMILLSIVMRCATFLEGPQESEYARLLRGSRALESQQLANKICSAVPFMLDMDLTAESLSTARAPHHKGVFEGGGAMMLIWSLFVASNIDCVPLIQRQWMRCTLRSISEDYGVGCAALLASRNVSYSGYGSPWL